MNPFLNYNNKPALLTVVIGGIRFAPREGKFYAFEDGRCNLLNGTESVYFRAENVSTHFLYHTGTSDEVLSLEISPVFNKV